jgi:phosphinothricin acetyltransferase
MAADNVTLLEPRGGLLIRRAREADLPEILAIYNEVISSSTAVYSLEASSLEERAAWLAARAGSGLPVLVAELEHRVAGFASFGEFRGVWPGYRYSVEQCPTNK